LILRLRALSSAEAPCEGFVCLGGRAGSDGKRERAGAFPARCRFSLSPGLWLRSLYGQKQCERGLCGRERA